jgi:hypothetical protein
MSLPKKLAVLIFLCGGWGCGMAQHVREGAETTQQIAILTNELPLAIERCRGLGAGATNGVVSAAFAVASTVDAASRAAQLVQEASVKCAPPTGDTVRNCMAIAQEMSMVCAPTPQAATVSVTYAPQTPPALAGTSAAPTVRPLGPAERIDAIEAYRLTVPEIVPCGSLAIMAATTRRLQAEESALASTYPGSVQEKYLSSLTRVVADHDERLAECRSNLRTENQLYPPLAK